VEQDCERYSQHPIRWRDYPANRSDPPPPAPIQPKRCIQNISANGRETRGEGARKLGDEGRRALKWKRTITRGKGDSVNRQRAIRVRITASRHPKTWGGDDKIPPEEHFTAPVDFWTRSGGPDTGGQTNKGDQDKREKIKKKTSKQAKEKKKKKTKTPGTAKREPRTNFRRVALHLDWHVPTINMQKCQSRRYLSPGGTRDCPGAREYRTLRAVNVGHGRSNQRYQIFPRFVLPYGLYTASGGGKKGVSAFADYFANSRHRATTTGPWSFSPNKLPKNTGNGGRMARKNTKTPPTKCPPEAHPRNGNLSRASRRFSSFFVMTHDAAEHHLDCHGPDWTGGHHPVGGRSQQVRRTTES